MSHEISIKFNGEYLHVRHTGADSYEISLELWRRIAKACEAHGCYRILGESDNSNVLSTLDAFKHIGIFREFGMSPKHHIAWVNHNPSAGRIFDFIETVLKNRFVFSGQLFKDVAHAKQWLSEQSDPPAR